MELANNRSMIFHSQQNSSQNVLLSGYRNWLTIIDIIATPDMAIGWYEHHSECSEMTVYGVL